MNFPGDNSIILTRETVQEIVRAHVVALMGDKVRITTLRGARYESIPSVEVSFTSDQPKGIPEGIPEDVL